MELFPKVELRIATRKPDSHANNLRGGTLADAHGTNTRTRPQTATPHHTTTDHIKAVSQVPSGHTHAPLQTSTPVQTYGGDGGPPRQSTTPHEVAVGLLGCQPQPHSPAAPSLQLPQQKPPTPLRLLPPSLRRKSCVCVRWESVDRSGEACCGVLNVLFINENYPN